MMALLERPGNRPQRTLRGHLRLAAAKAAVFTIALVASFFTLLVVADLNRPAAEVPVQQTVDPAVAKIAELRCSTTGFPNGEIPASALVRRGRSLEQVSFGAGWAAYEGRAPGTLVAVCRAPLAG